MKLLIDIGNTRIKWAVEKDNIIKNSIAIEHNENDFISLILQAWLDLERPEKIIISCVSRKEIVNQLIAVAKNIWSEINVIVAKSSASMCSINNAYKQANKLGVDRWLALIALHHYYPGDGVVVDCGTAITIDVLNKQGQHLGGVISPGLQLMKHSLFQGTESLSNVDQAFSVGLSSNTESAVYSGTIFSAVGLIDKVVNDYTDCQTLVLTGGDAELLSQYLNYKVVLEPDFVLKGLSLYSRGEFE